MRVAGVAVFLAVAAAAAQTPPPQIVQPPPDVAGPPADAQKTSSGLATRVLQPGNGQDHPTVKDVVTVNYTGWTTDGKLFDSSVVGGKPTSFALNGVIAGFTETLQLMVPGEKRRAWIPESLAYKGQRAPRGMLVFDIELIGIPNRPPPDVKAPPTDAKTTASGLAYNILREGAVDGGRREGTLVDSREARVQRPGPPVRHARVRRGAD